MRIAKPLTALGVQKAKPKEKPYALYDGNGLFLRISVAGRKSWAFKYKEPAKGRYSVISIGRYPDISLDDARKKATELRVRLLDGESIRKEKVLRFDAVAREWHAYEKDASEWTEKTAHRAIRILEMYIFPEIGKADISRLNSPDLLDLLKGIEATGALETVKRMKTVLSQIYRYAMSCGYVTSNPVPALTGAIKPVKKKHFASVTNPDDVASILKKLWSYEGTYPVACALKIAVYCFMRPGELRTMQWDNVDFEKAEYRYHVGKTDIDQIVPLSNQVIKILRTLKQITGHGQWVFSMREKPMSENTVNNALRSMGITGQTLVGHGFRAMARTLLDEELGYRIDYIEQQLAHSVRDPLGRAYNRTTHLKARKEMMQEWADYLDKLRTS